ncbi:MAG: TetR/AcrR family transcriptional regulator [Gammaproteobacteria bacterium]|nr:TetR/AcrR family transcriptional regulator [Gammaproteobacteria bacterium]
MKASSRERRRSQILDIAGEVLAERGYRDTSMLEVARRASASKETLYAWFGDKEGLFKAIIRRNAESVRVVLDGHLEGDAPVNQVLTEFGLALAGLLLGESAAAVNRAAISEAYSSPSLARNLNELGREATLPSFIRYLENCNTQGTLRIGNPREAAETFIGLLLGDAQVRRLLGVMDTPDMAEIEARAGRASRRFIRLFGT